MTPEEIPADVLRFIREQIDTVPHLEALLLLWESAPRAWTTAELAARLYVTSDIATRIVGDFTRRRLIASTPSGVVYDASNEHAKLLPELARTYGRQLVQVTRFIHSKGSPAMQEFARAFKFKQDGR